MTMTTAIVWFRQDLRLADNPALYEASTHCDLIIPLYIDDTADKAVVPGGASRVWLYHSLLTLAKDLQTDYQAHLIVRQQDPLECLQQLIEAHDVSHVYWNRCYTPSTIERDSKIKEHLSQVCKVKSCKAGLINEPWELLKKDGDPYRVFTPFWKASLANGINDQPLARPQRIKTPSKMPDCLSPDEMGLLPEIRWDMEMMSHWQSGEASAHQKLTDFLHAAAANYKDKRDMPSTEGTSKLSPHLHFGEISPRQIAHAALQIRDQHPRTETGINTFLSEVGWREFAYNLLYHFPHTVEKPLNKKFADFPWAHDYEANLLRWQQGQTGIPIIDAGMRQLWRTGWMHNRVRMIVASFLTKNLLIPWQEGEAWFRDTLVDADLASNVMGWQWVAGSGADAAPYFRIFNPVLQSEKFDADGEYIRRWVPELKQLDNKKIHQPYEEVAGYPQPLVDLKRTRERALEAYKKIK